MQRDNIWEGGFFWKAPFPKKRSANSVYPYTWAYICMRICVYVHVRARVTYPRIRTLLPAHPSFPLEGCANEAPGVSLFHSHVGPTQRRATALAVGQVRPSGHSIPAVGETSPTAAYGPQDVHLRGHFPDGGTSPSTCPFLCSVLLVASASCAPPSGCGLHPMRGGGGGRPWG